MKRAHIVLCLVFIFLSVTASAGADSYRYLLNPGSQQQPHLLAPGESLIKQPTFSVVSNDETGCLLDFNLSTVLMEELEIKGIRYSALTIPGGAMGGKVGEPGLPVYSGMLSVPDGLAVQVLSTVKQQRVFADMTVLPVQSDVENEFVINEDFYSGKMAGLVKGKTHELITLGEPAIYHGVRVVPFTVNPVSFDSATNQITTVSQLEINFTFSGVDHRAKSHGEKKLMPESFAGILADQLVNPPNMDSGPGAYLVISPTSSSVTAALQPLLDWRKRQGYTVIHATTGLIGTSTTAIKNYIQTQYDSGEVPLEFVVLVGDADGPVTLSTWHETLSGDYGEGDHYYTTLEGNDILPDVLIGRLSVRNPTELTTIVNKIISYETNPPLAADPNWINRAALASDPSSSGISTIYVAQWLKAQLQDLGYAQVDTIFDGSFPNQMFASLNQGLGVFAYRGFGGMSGFTTGHINALSNGGKLPFAVIPTCNTGSFHTYPEARSEAFLRASNGGAIGSIALSTGGTHTRYNNCLYHGIWEGMLHSTNHTLGAAHSRGKIEVYNNYFAAEPHIPEIWAVWSNLMGDPATDMWLSNPEALSVDHPLELPLGAGSVPVTVIVNGLPKAGLKVALYKAGEVTAYGYTNAAGQVNIPLPAHTNGTLLVTVTGHDHLPYRGSLALGTADVFANLNESIFDDGNTAGSGNGDGVINPGETVELKISLNNLGVNLAGGVSAVLTTADAYATVIDGNEYFGDIAPGGSQWCDEFFTVALAADTPANHQVDLTIVATDGAHSWTSLLPLIVESAALVVTDFSWTGGGSTMNPGESGVLTFTLKNGGTTASGTVSSILATESPWLLVTDKDGQFANISPGDSGQNSSDTFAITVAGDCFNGHLATFTLETTLASGATQIVEYQVRVGEATASDPLGPDSYGYYALDNTDSGHFMAPQYDWIEIDPNHGGSGTSVGLTDTGWELDDTRTMDIPFSFGYYGVQYEEIAICSNGWMTMGSTTLQHYRNFTIPSAGSPNRMIAPFWDNLYQTGSNQVYTWYDEANHRFIIQWSRMQNHPGQTQNFQVVLFDPQVHMTSSGDGQILFQYDTVANTDVTNGFATVGIQNTDGTDGLLYTYWNTYSAAAATLEAGRAILFLPLGLDTGVTCDVNPSEINITMAPETQDDRVISIANNGEPGSVLSFNISKVDAALPGLVKDGNKSLLGSSMVANYSEYDVGAVMDIEFTAICSSNDDEYIVQVALDFPAGVVVNSGTSMNGTMGNLDFDGPTGDGANISWSGVSGFLMNGDEGVARLNLDFTAASGTVEIPYTLTGDVYGSAPHVITGVIVLEQSGPSVQVLNPNGGELLEIGETRTISFVAGNVDNVVIELDRGLGEGWEELTSNYPAASGAFEWEVSGAVSNNCRLKISDQANSEVSDQSNNVFTIGRSLAWLQLGLVSGSVPVDSPQTVTLTFDTTGLDEGTYALDLLVSNSAGSPVVVSVNLTVSNGVSPVSELPSQLTLRQNHPNPFNPQTSISFSLPAAGVVKLNIYNATGGLVRTLIDESLPSGLYQQVWDGTDAVGRRVASGLYLYRLETPTSKLTRKMLMVK